MDTRRGLIALAIVGFTTSATAVGSWSLNFGLYRDNQLRAHSQQLFGVGKPLEASSTEDIGGVLAEADPRKLVTLAGGLRVDVLSAQASLGPNVDMMALWPDDSNPTHLILCNEEGEAEPGVQRVRLATGAVETIMSGLDSCDPVRRTEWGTILVGEETDDGWVLEIIKPLDTTGVTFNRATGTASGGTGAANVAGRPAVGHLAFEGLALLPNGVLYYGDENRPLNGTPGGSYFKFIPTTPWSGSKITDLSQSPLSSGKVYGLRLGKRSSNTDYGQGTNTGQGTWIEVVDANNANLRAAAATLKLTGYYRPEDAEVDREALSEGHVRFCANNTGNEGQDRLWGEAICVTDGTIEEAVANKAIPEVQHLVIGTPELAMMDNIAFQPGRGNWIIHEDGDGPGVGRNNDLWSCLDDGDDDDYLSDGCVRIGTLNDLTAEWTGGIFDKWGNHFYVSVQHNATGHGVILDITGWR